MRAQAEQVADGVHLVRAHHVNWVILQDGADVTLIDTGYPGDRQALLDSLAAVGSSPEAVTAVLITHAHNDHVGSAEYLRDAHGTPSCCIRPKCRTPGGTSSSSARSKTWCATPGGPVWCRGRRR